MLQSKKAIITISDDEGNDIGHCGTVDKPQHATSPPSANTTHQTKECKAKSESLGLKSAVIDAAQGESSQGRSTSVSGLSSGQNPPDVETRSRSEPYGAAAQLAGMYYSFHFYRCSSDSSFEGAGKRVNSGCKGQQASKVATSALRPSALYHTVSAAPMAYMGPQPGKAYGLSTSTCAQSTATKITPTQTMKQDVLKSDAPATASKPKRKSNEISSQPVKRKKTPASSGPSKNISSSAVDSILWSCPPYDPSKDSKKEGKVDESSASKPKQPRKPRSKPWTCKMLADLSALIQKSVPWGEFAEKNGKALADVLETYSVVVSMPLLDFAERGQARIAQKKFKEMRQRYKEMEKDAVKIGNEQAKKEAEEYFGTKKRGKTASTR